MEKKNIDKSIIQGLVKADVSYFAQVLIIFTRIMEYINDVSSETAEPNLTKFNLKLQWGRGEHLLRLFQFVDQDADVPMY